MKNYLIFLILFIGINFSYSQSTVDSTIMHNDIERDFSLYIPASYDGATAVPLLFNLHGLGSNKEEQEFYGDFRDIADTANFIIVHPNGSEGFGTRFWNVFGDPSYDDVGFLVALIDSISEAYNIDSTRVYSTGMSNGGFMSFELACYTSDRFAAVASVTGSMFETRMNGCATNRPIPSMSIHGTNDETVPYEGDEDFVSVPELIDHWSSQINADPEPFMIKVPDIEPDDGSTVEHYIYPNGDRGARFEHFKVVDGDHTWPGATFGGANQDIDASVEIWLFFRQFSLENEDLVPLEIVKTADVVCPGGEEAVLEVSSSADISDYTFTWTDRRGNTLGTGTTITVGAGLYHVSGTDGISETYNAVYVVSDPIISVEEEITIVSSDTALIEIIAEGGTGEFSFSWVGPNDFTSTDQNITVTENGEYTVTITDESGCDTTASFTVGTLSNDVHIFSETKVKLYPNPSKDGVVKLSSSKTIEHVKVVDVLGKVVYQDNPMTKDYTFKVEKNGVYVTTFQIGEDFYRRKFIISK